MNITSDAMLESILIQLMGEIVGSISDQMYILLVGDEGFIKAIVYDPYVPEKYERQMENGGLLGEWEQTPPQFNAGDRSVTSIIGENTDSMTHEPENFIHGSFYWKKTDDIRDMLSYIITEGASGDFFGEGFWRKKRDFWTPFIKLVQKGKVNKMVEQELKSRNIKFKKIK